MGKNAKFVVGALCIAAAVVYLIFTGIRETSVYYLTIDEFLAKKEGLADEGVRVAGRVRKGSVAWNPKDLRLRFTLGTFSGDGGVPVDYRGILPDMFAEGRDVIIEGTYTPHGIFQAHTILTSCPSKYEPEASEAGNGKP